MAAPLIQFAYAVPGGHVSMPNPMEYTNILRATLVGEPRVILQLLGWTVGDTCHQQNAAALVISTLLALVIIMIYVCSSFTCCNLRMRQHKAALRRAAQRELHGGQVATRATRGPVSSRFTDDPILDYVWSIHNKRYDLRSYVARHPGGADAISLGQGRNCTELFESYHSLANEKLVRATLARYYIEDVQPHASDYQNLFEWRDTPFYNMLKVRIRAHFDQKQGVRRGHRADLWQWTQLIVFIIASGFALCGFMRAELLSMLLLPFCYWWGPSPCMHDGSHFSLSQHPWVNRLFANVGGAHMSLFSWYHQHVIGHHVHTNMPGRDPDLYHFAIGADQGNPGFRTSIELRTLPEKTFTGTPRSSFWRKGLRLRMPFTTFGPSVIWDMQSLVIPDMQNAFLGIVPFHMISDWRLAAHSVGRSIVIWLTIVHPITVSLVTAGGWCSGALRAFMFVSAPWAIHGCLFYIFSQLSHIQHQCFTVKVDEANSALWHHEHPCDKNEIRFRRAKARVASFVKHSAEAATPLVEETAETELCTESTVLQEWAVHQVEHSVDYAVDSKFWLHVSNGLNLQVVHHLFPQVGWGHYRELSVIIQEVSDACGVTYSTEPTFWAAAASHFKYLAHINEGPLASVWVQPPVGSAPRDALDLLDQVDWKPVPPRPRGSLLAHGPWKQV